MRKAQGWVTLRSGRRVFFVDGVLQRGVIVDEHPVVRPARHTREDQAVMDQVFGNFSSPCAGGTCTTIDQMCTRHQSSYQADFGRASNE